VTAVKQNQHFIVVHIINPFGWTLLDSKLLHEFIHSNNNLTGKNDYNFNSAAGPRVKKTGDICFVTNKINLYIT